MSNHASARPAKSGPRSPFADRGSSLLEALVAVGLIASALAAVAHLAGESVRSLAASRDRSVATVIAAQKVEQLLSWPTRPPISPSGTLDADTEGYVEYLDGRGRVSGVDARFEGTVYVRRWSVVPLARDPRLVVMQVRAGRCRAGSLAMGCEGLLRGSRLDAVRPEEW